MTKKLYEQLLVVNEKVSVLLNNNDYNDLVLSDFWYEITPPPPHTLTSIPEEILIIPFILNIAPVVWISGEVFSINKMDFNLVQSLSRLKSAFQKMYPLVRWDGEIKVKETVNIDYKINENASVLLFSGGLDSITTSFRHLTEKQTLVTIRGSDVTLDDEVGWEKVKHNTAEYSQKYGFENYCVESNFFDFLNQDKLSSLYGIEWWSYIQHGMGLASFMAVPAYLSHSKTGYIASSHSFSFGDNPWGSAPMIDNEIAWSKVNIFHDGFELSRQEKLEYVVRKKETPVLRVCYTSKGGENCCKCEKCVRTITGLIAAGSSWREYGFPVDIKTLRKYVMRCFSKDRFVFEENTLIHWQDIKEHLRDKKYYEDLKYDPDMLLYVEWIRNYNFIKYKQRNESRRLLKRKVKNLIENNFPPLLSLYRTVKRVLCSIIYKKY